MRGTQLFYNEKGTGNDEKDTREENIDSKNVSDENDKTDKKKTKSSKKNNFNLPDFDFLSFVNSDVFINIVKIIINFIFLLGLLFIVNYLFTYITNNKTRSINSQTISTS